MKIIKQINRLIFKVRYNTDKFRKLKSLVCAFYDYHYEPQFHFNSFRITKFRFYDYPKAITIEIHSLSPGMIIGPRGAHIDALKKYINDIYGKPVHVELKETNPFK